MGVLSRLANVLLVIVGAIFVPYGIGYLYVLTDVRSVGTPNSICWIAGLITLVGCAIFWPAIVAPTINYIVGKRVFFGADWQKWG